MPGVGDALLLLKENMDRDRRFAGLKELVKYRSDGGTKVDIDWKRPEPNSDHTSALQVPSKKRVGIALRRAMRPLLFTSLKRAGQSRQLGQLKAGAVYKSHGGSNSVALLLGVIFLPRRQALLAMVLGAL